MAPKKSIFRAPGAQHFQLVHRSQQDPLINDPEASQRVLKPVGRANDKKVNYTLADLEATLDHSQLRENEGEAALYGITYDDSQYDYMAHLKPIGVGGGAVESVMIAGPRGSGVASGMKRDPKGKGKAKAEDLFVPREVLASETERPVEDVWASQEAIPRELQGLQPDMDPHLRQVLEALDDDAFIDADDEAEGDGGDWFGQLLGGGERKEYDSADWKFEEWGVDDGDRPLPRPIDAADGEDEEGREESWEDRFKAFKQSQRDGPGSAQGEGLSDVVSAERSEMADTVGTLGVGMADLMVAGGKKRRGKRGPSDATGMSMSSSSVFRTSGLTDLDARFDKIERDYDLNDDEEEEYYSDDDNVSIAASQMSSLSTFSKASLFSHASAAPPDISREDFDAILDDFLDNYEILGRKMRPALGNVGLTGPEKLAVLRGAIESEQDGIGKEENRRRILQIEKMGRGVRSKLGKGDKAERVRREEDEGEKWDAETILTTYTNSENHPGMIRSRRPAEARRRAEQLALSSALDSPAAADDVDEDDEDTSGSETEREGPKVTVSRPKGESAEERKARKAAVKADRSALAVDLLNPSAEKQAHTHKLKKIVPTPNSFFMDVKCPGCFQITTVFSHASTVVQCGSCATVLCQPTGGKARLTEGCSFRRKN